MAEPQMPATKLKVPNPDPFNLQAVKRYVFNETGNIMMASTELGSEEIQQDVRDVFAEVSVFFAAMTRAMSTTINPTTQKFYSIYDYAAIESIVDGSGLFIQVSEEDVTHTIDSWGATVSKELVEGLLGLASGSGEMVFAQAMISSIGKRGLQMKGGSDTQDSRVGTIVFVCEYLLGMPIISALVCYVDSRAAGQHFSAGPCIKEHSTSLHLTMHKDTYMFVTPNFIRKYSGDLTTAETDLDYIKLVDYLQDLVERKPVVTAVVNDAGDPASNQLTKNNTYHILGSFLTQAPAPKKGNTIVYTVEFDGGENMIAGDPQEGMVSFTPTKATTKPTPAIIYANEIASNHGKTSDPIRKTLITTTTNAYTVYGVPKVDEVVAKGATTKVSENILKVESVYTIKGENLIGGEIPSSITVEALGSSGAVKIDGTPTATEVSFKVNSVISSATEINIMFGEQSIVSVGKFIATEA